MSLCGRARLTSCFQLLRALPTRSSVFSRSSKRQLRHRKPARAKPVTRVHTVPVRTFYLAFLTLCVTAVESLADKKQRFQAEQQAPSVGGSSKAGYEGKVATSFVNASNVVVAVESLADKKQRLQTDQQATASSSTAGSSKAGYEGTVPARTSFSFSDPSCYSCREPGRQEAALSDGCGSVLVAGEFEQGWIRG